MCWDTSLLDFYYFNTNREVLLLKVEQNKKELKKFFSVFENINCNDCTDTQWVNLCEWLFPITIGKQGTISLAIRYGSFGHRLVKVQINQRCCSLNNILGFPLLKRCFDENFQFYYIIDYSLKRREKANVNQSSYDWRHSNIMRYSYFYSK